MKTHSWLIIYELRSCNYIPLFCLYSIFNLSIQNVLVLSNRYVFKMCIPHSDELNNILVGCGHDMKEENKKTERRTWLAKMYNWTKCPWPNCLRPSPIFPLPYAVLVLVLLLHKPCICLLTGRIENLAFYTTSFSQLTKSNCKQKNIRSANFQSHVLWKLISPPKMTARRTASSQVLFTYFKFSE